MSLFENDQYRWRETYFVLFERENRPSVEEVKRALQAAGERYQVTDVRSDEEGHFESLTLQSPYDFAAMDITFVEGEDLEEQVQDLMEQLVGMPLTPDERDKMEMLPLCNARYDVFHFERVVSDVDGDEFLDPGSLLLVLERLARLCQGVGVDPQAGTVM